MIVVEGRFQVDSRRNPPPLKPMEHAADGTGTLRVGSGITMRLGDHRNLMHSLLDHRVHIDNDLFRGLGGVDQACEIYCVSNTCSNWAVRNRRPRLVAGVVGVMADEPRYVLLTVPRFVGASRARRESPANRLEAGLTGWILNEPGNIECPRCPGPNRGVVRVAS